jgi:hypothetical protein
MGAVRGCGATPRQLDARTSGGSVELGARGLLGAGDEMAVDPVEHVDARAHVPREFEQADAGTDRVRRERVAQGVDRAVPDPSRFERGPPLASAPVVQVDQRLFALAKASGEPILGGTAASASSAILDSGTLRRDRCVLPYGRGVPRE